MESKLIITRKTRKKKKQDDSACSCSSSCCDNGNVIKDEKIAVMPFLDEKYITGLVQTSVGNIPLISTKLTAKDLIGSLKVRWNINRMKYTVNPGIYGVGSPNENSPVLVTANYKLSFDKLRSQLSMLDAWIMVLDTKGINVWCAAGKGTFATNELVRRISLTHLADIVKHKTIILPQLGATGVAAHIVAKKSGFKVIYGPVRAEDIKDFIASKMKATKDMRTVKFTLLDRLVLTPVELVAGIKPLAIIFGVMFILDSIGFGSFGLMDLVSLIGAVLIGCVITPVLLPYIPGRAFSIKGFLLGIIWAVAVVFIYNLTSNLEILKGISFILILPIISAFLSLNFTGSSTYTSPTGVNKEMRSAIPLMIISLGIGVILLIIYMLLKLILKG